MIGSLWPLLCTIHYKDIGDYHSREKKLGFIRKFISLKGVTDWEEIEPDEYCDWKDQRHPGFYAHLPIGSKDAKAGKENAVVFGIYSNGVATARDVWVYNSSKEALSKNMQTHISYCKSQDINNPVYDSKKGKWDSDLSRKLKKFGQPVFDQAKIRTALYRPFFKQMLYFDHIFNPRQGIVPFAFPHGDSQNLVICVPYKFTGNFSAFVTNITLDLELVHHSQCFPLHVYENDTRKDNITDFALLEYRNHYKDAKITKQDIFYYVYGLLHNKGYRKKYANNLIRDLPHISMAPDFWIFSKIGKKLADLHLSWETCKRYNLGKPKNEFGKYAKMAFARKSKDGKQVNDTTTLKINGMAVFDNIPDIQYKVNGRTPLEWAIDRYKVTTDKDSGIMSDSTNVDIMPLIERLVYVGV